MVAKHDRTSVPRGASKITASAIVQPVAEAKFTDTLIIREASVKSGSSLIVPGTTATNAWLPVQVYRVDACLRVEVLP